MDYKFIDKCRAISQRELYREEIAAQDSIINILFRMKLRGAQKARQIDEYDGESLFDRTTLLLGNIYAFSYAAKEPTVYERGQYHLTYYDSLPVLLVTHSKGRAVSGINLNLCNTGLRAFVINALHNLDPEFYHRQHLDMATRRNAPYSRKVASVFAVREKETAFLNFIKQQCKLTNSDMLYRNYNIDRIREIRLIEVWQHIHIPFLRYHGEIKKDVLEAIYKLTEQEQLVLT